MRTSSLNSTDAVQRRRISAPCFLDDLFGLDGIAERLVHGLAFAIEHPAVEGARAIGRATLEARADQQRTVEPAAVLIAAFEIHVGRPGQAEALVEHGEMARAGIEPDVENVVLFAEFVPPPHLAHVWPAAASSAAVRSYQMSARVLAEERDDAVENLAIGDAARGRRRNRTR